MGRFLVGARDMSEGNLKNAKIRLLGRLFYNFGIITTWKNLHLIQLNLRKTSR
jgi:hypothetical protein